MSLDSLRNALGETWHPQGPYGCLRHDGVQIERYVRVEQYGGRYLIDWTCGACTFSLAKSDSGEISWQHSVDHPDLIRCASIEEAKTVVDSNVPFGRMEDIPRFSSDGALW